MNPEKALSRLCAKTGSLESNVRSTDNTFLKPSDIAFALGGLDDLSSNLILFKYAQGGDQEYRRLLLLWFGKIKLVCLREGWARKGHKISDNRLLMFAQSTLDEFAGDRLCVLCNGIGAIRSDERFEICPDCEGHRVQGWTYARRARACDMDAHNFRARWKVRYNSCLGRLINMEQYALSVVKNRLG